MAFRFNQSVYDIIGLRSTITELDSGPTDADDVDIMTLTACHIGTDTVDLISEVRHEHHHHEV